MATTAQPRPCVELTIPDDHSSVLGALPLGNIQNRKPSGVDLLTRQFGNLHIHSNDKENGVARVPVTSLGNKDAGCDSSHKFSVASISTASPDPEVDFEHNNPLALASRDLPSTEEQLSKHQEGQFEWLLSIPVKTSAKECRPRDESHGDAEPRRGEKTLYFGCNLVHRRSLSGASLRENGKSTDVYTLLATRIGSKEKVATDMSAEMEHVENAAEHLEVGLDVPRDGAAGGSVGEPSRPVSRIEDSVEALDKLEEEIEALTEVAQLERVLSPDGANPVKQTPTGGKSTPMKRATSVKAGASSGRGKAVERSSSVRKATSTPSATEDEKAAAGGSTGRKVPRPASLLPPKPPARSSKPPTVPAFELPGEAVARRLKEQREQRRSQQISPEQAAALAAAYSPSKPHVKSNKPPTRPTFELPGEAISRKKREEHEAKLRAQEEEERKRRQFKARPIRASLAPSSVPRETLASQLRQKQRQTETSTDSNSTTITLTTKKRQSTAAPATTTTTTTTSTSTSTSTATTLPTRGRGPTTDQDHPAGQHDLSSRATSTSTASIHRSGSTASGRSGQSKRSTISAEEAAQQKQRGKEVFARDNSFTAERERERRERENAAKLARQQAAERSRMLSREWAEKQRLKKEKERERMKSQAATVA
ncbi:hypothetical protein C8A03DRAFT_30810 [Achaetomium macrosporum]|uniref:Carboxylesterase family protein n=1 Tax=Achaetomium macrosporum TaxID=79813 RepID=A0AAN7CFE8_9PEZI|nr:hypothetical protein C8A03DRAFT_30810 [Achaetomium macrosporum]